MKKLLLVLISSYIFILSGCVNDKVDVKLPCDEVISESIIDVKNAMEQTEHTICGVITAHDYDDNFFIQDKTAGIYVYGSHVFSDQLDHSFVGKTVLLQVEKSTYLESDQVTLHNKGDFTIIDESNHRSLPIELWEFSNINHYEGQLVKLVNVNLSEAKNNVRRITDQNGKDITRVYFGPEVEFKNKVDIIGVLYKRTNRPSAMVISSIEDINSTETFDDQERMNLAYKYLNVPKKMNISQTLPTYLNEVSVEWQPDTDDIKIVNGGIRFNRDVERKSIKLTAILFYKSLDVVRKTFEVEVINQALYELPENYVYDGPTFPVETKNKDFWNRGGGSVGVTFQSCADGDTARFLIDGKVELTRFFNVDTEEMYHPDYGAEEWGKPASLYTCKVLSEANEIYLQGDIADGPREVHGRLIAWIWVDGRLLQYELVSLGLAEVEYLFGAETYTDILIEAQNEAIENKMGKYSGKLDPYWDYQNKRLKN